jgi:uncharacterized membrane protein (UPF0127 family)
MKYKRVAIVLIISLVSLFLVKIYVNKDLTDVCFQDGYCVKAEVKDTLEDRALGLMFREKLDEDKGMLFIFEKPDTYSFWMKNMKISIDIIFLNENKEIVSIHEKVLPCFSDPCPMYGPDEPSLYVVEVQEGFSKKHGLEEGQKIEFN